MELGSVLHAIQDKLRDNATGHGFYSLYCECVSGLSTCRLFVVHLMLTVVFTLIDYTREYPRRFHCVIMPEWNGGRPVPVHALDIRGFLGDPQQGGGSQDLEVVGDLVTFVQRHTGIFCYDAVTKRVSLRDFSGPATYASVVSVCTC